MKRLVSIILMLLVAFAAMGQTAAGQKERKARLEKEIRMLETQLKETAGKSASAMNTLTLVRKKVSNRQALLDESEKEIARLDDSIAVRQAQIDQLQGRMDTLSTYYNRLVRNAYKNRDSRVWYMYLLASRNLGQAARRYSYLRSLSTQMNAQAARINETRTELEIELELQKEARARVEEMRIARQAELGALQKEQKQSEALVASLNSEKKKYQKQLTSKKQQVESLNREIQRLIASEMNASGKGNTKKSGSSTSGNRTVRPVDTKLAAEFSANQGKLPWPCEGVVTGHFGKHYHPVYKSIELPFNNGVNISVSKGTKAHAVFDGEVRKVIVMPGYNKCVLVQHGDYFTFYCKLGNVNVKAGDKIKTGATVGTVDTIDGETQLHFQLWKGSKPQDPEKWLNR